MIWESPVFFGCKNGHGSSCCFEMRQIFFTNAVGLGSVPASVLWAPEKKKTSCQMKISMSHAFSCVPVSSQLSAECQFFPCWATEWAVGFVDSTRFTGKGCSLGSSLYSLSRCSLGNPSKFFSLYCPAKISHCCLERNIWRVRKKITSTELLSSSRTSSGFGGGHEIDVVKKEIFPRTSCVMQTQLQQYRLPFAKWKFAILQSPELGQSGFCTFWRTWK